jgi:hypothetical protein
MATIKVQEINRQLNQRVEVVLDVRTSMGKIILPFKFDDQGSDEANEKHAHRELRQWLKEADQALDLLSGQ